MKNVSFFLYVLTQEETDGLKEEQLQICDLGGRSWTQVENDRTNSLEGLICI